MKRAPPRKELFTGSEYGKCISVHMRGVREKAKLFGIASSLS